MLTQIVRAQVPLTSRRLLHSTPPQRLAAAATTSTHPTKAAGDISSVFPSLSGTESLPLPPRFADLKRRLIDGHEEQVQESWHRLLAELREETKVIREAGSSIIPEISFSDVKYDNIPKITEFRDKLKKRGVAIIRGVVSEQEAFAWKELIKRYIAMNPSVKGFPADKPAVYELYWSPSQVLARAHPNLLKAQSFLMSHWHSVDKTALVSTSHPVTYADRLRIRQPGDGGFALGPHIDGGSCERWEEAGYGRGHVYTPIFHGSHQTFDPWESSARLPAITDLYNSPGGCSTFRMFQGWLSLSTTSAHEGTLLVNPLFSKATAYFLLRPFFSPIRPPQQLSTSEYLSSTNWHLPPTQTSTLHGAVPAACQELSPALHPHLDLPHTMTHIPTVHPGDYVAWHADTIHAVDRTHTGVTDSSVMYIPCCPLTEANAAYLARQREAFWEGAAGPDFPQGGEGGDGEGGYVGRLTPDFVMEHISPEARRGMGLERFDDQKRGVSARERKMQKRANEILGF